MSDSKSLLLTSETIELFYFIHLFIFTGRLEAHEQIQREIQYEKNKKLKNKNKTNAIKRLEKDTAPTHNKKGQLLLTNSRDACETFARFT